MSEPQGMVDPTHSAATAEQIRGASALRYWYTKSVLVQASREVAALIVVVAVLLVAYTTTLAPSVTWANHGVDSGDLITAAATLGIAHPSGYPTYLLLARLFQAIPVGDLAWRTNLLSLVAGILAAVLLGRGVYRMCGPGSWHGLFAGGCAALAFGLSPIFWSQAVIAEVYTLNGLFVAMLFGWIIEDAYIRAVTSSWRPMVRGVFAGLALGNHLTVVPMLLAWFIAILLISPRGSRMSGFGRALLGFGCGLLVYLYLPIRAAAHPPINWGNPVNWASFWWVVAGAPYQTYGFGLPIAAVPGHLALLLSLFLQQYGTVGLVLAGVGLVCGQKKPAWFAWGSVGMALVYGGFALLYHTEDAYLYSIPALLIMAVWIGNGCSVLMNWLMRWHESACLFAALAIVLLLFWQAPKTHRQVDASHDQQARMFAEQVLSNTPPQAVVITSVDHDTFSLWYAHYALSERPDINVVVTPLLEFAWYRENLRHVYPTLHIPDDPPTDWATALAAANTPHPVCVVDQRLTGEIACR